MDKPEKSASIRPSVIIVPARFFHAECADCPENASVAEAVAVAALAVEERAPLPTEQLVDGIRRAGGKLIAFVGVKKRLDAVIPKDSATAPHLIPEAALPPPPSDFAGWRWFSAARGSLVAIKISAGSALPVATRGFTVPDDADDATILSLKKQYADSLKDAPHETGVWRLDDILRHPKGGARLAWSNSDTAGESFLSAADLALADLRDSQTVLALRRNEQTSVRISFATKGLAVAAVVLMFSQIALWGMGGVARWRESQLEKSRPDAERAEAETTLLTTLDRVTERRLPALERLALINNSRPDGVTLTRATFADAEVRATGTARSMGELNTWLATLRKNPAFTAVETPSIRSASDRTTFELRVTAKPGTRR